MWFGTIDNNIINEYMIANIYRYTTGKSINPNNFYEIKRVAKEFSGITGIIDHPSVNFLIKNNHILSAVSVYQYYNKCTFLEANRAVMNLYNKIGGNKHGKFNKRKSNSQRK